MTTPMKIAHYLFITRVSTETIDQVIEILVAGGEMSPRIGEKIKRFVERNHAAS